MSNQRNYLEEARQNVLNLAYDLDLTMKALDAFVSAGYKYFDPMRQEDRDRNEFFTGLSMMRNALFNRYNQQMANCFALVGVANPEMLEFAKKKFKERFGGDYSIIEFLDKNGHLPSSWLSSEKDEFKKRVAEELAKMGKH